MNKSEGMTQLEKGVRRLGRGGELGAGRKRP